MVKTHQIKTQNGRKGENNLLIIFGERDNQSRKWLTEKRETWRRIRGKK